MGRSKDDHGSYRRRSHAARGLLSLTALALIALPTGMAAASQPLPDPLPQPPPIDGCVADPASCLPEAPAVDGCLEDPASCLPPAPEVDPCLEDPASCLPEPPPVDQCVQDPESCVPEGQEVDRCIDAPQSCLPEVRNEEDPGQEEDHGKGDDDEESAAPVKSADPPRKSKAGPAASEGGRARPAGGPEGPSSATFLRERPASNVIIGPDGILDRIGRGITDAVQRFAFPLAVAGLVAAFVLVQGRIDRRDPKLAAAPIDSRDDVVEFR